jgi:hypothetical protein
MWHDHQYLFRDRVSEYIRRRDEDRVFPAVFVISIPRRHQFDRPLPVPVDDLIGEYILNYWFALVVYTPLSLSLAGFDSSSG